MVSVNQILDLVLHAGRIMLQSGAETYRVEDTIEKLGYACGATKVDAFATPTGVFVTVVDAEGNTATRIVRIRKTESNLNKVAEVNQISRDVCEGISTCQEACARLHSIDSQGRYAFAVREFSAGLVCLGFAYIFGGHLKEMILSFFVGILVYLGVQVAKRSRVSGASDVIGGIIASAMAGVLSFVISELLQGVVIVSSLMVLTPGVAITNSIRDLMSGDLVTGVSRIAEAFLITVEIAVGVLLGLTGIHVLLRV